MKNNLIFLFILIGFHGFAQSSRKNTYTALVTNVFYGAHLPVGDLAKRFGANFTLGGGIELITEKGNWIFGLKGNNIFGSNVKEDVLSVLRDSDGFILASAGGGNGTYANVYLRERGFYGGGLLGKLIPISTKNKRAGLRITFGVGVLQHKVRIQDESGNADQLQGNYIKGYDQLSNGLAFEQFIGYQQLNRETGLNFFAGFEFSEAFTTSRRDYNFSTPIDASKKRFDALVGFKVGWSLPIYVGERGEDIQY